MKFIMILISTLLLSGCITVYECEGDHKETYNNISPTTQPPEDNTNSKQQ